jgi:hypothetical protein
MVRLLRYTSWKNAGIGFVALAFGVGYLLLIPLKIPNQRAPFGIDSRFFPEVAGLLLVTCAVVLLLREFFRRSEAMIGEEGAGMRVAELKQLLPKLLVVIAYVVLIEPVGYLTSTIAALAVLLAISGSRAWIVVGAISLIVPAGLYYFFVAMLEIRLPAGLFM